MGRKAEWRAEEAFRPMVDARGAPQMLFATRMRERRAPLRTLLYARHTPNANVAIVMTLRMFIRQRLARRAA
jgi:hypothetical protein